MKAKPAKKWLPTKYQGISECGDTYVVRARATVDGKEIEKQRVLDPGTSLEDALVEKKCLRAELIGEPVQVIKPRKPNPTCQLCNLHKTSQTVCCLGSGPKSAKTMLVGEALGVNEAEKGKPFCGDAGWKLNYCLKRAGLNRKELRIENTCRCKPPGNKNPTIQQISACYGYLLRDILVNKPKVVVALGSIAFKTLTGQIEINKKGEQKVKLGARSVSDWRGFYEQVTLSWTSKKGKIYNHTFWLVPTFHPAACLHDWQKDDLLVFDLLLAKELAAGKQPLKEPDTKVYVVKDFVEAKHLIARLKRQARFVFDLETTGLSPHDSKIMCFGFCFKEGEAWILPWHTRGPTPFWRLQERRELVELLTQLFEQASLIGQNLKFDLKHIRKLLGLTDFNINFDTMIAHHNIDENKLHGLTFLCQWFLRWTKYDAAMDQWKVKAGKKTIFKTWEVPDQMLWKYCGYDCDGPFRLRKIFLPLLKKEGTVKAYKNHMGLVHPLMDAEYRGIQCDKHRLLYLSSKFRKEADTAIKKLRKRADKYLGEVRDSKGKPVIFNPESPKQLANLLEAAGAKLSKKTKGKTGFSTDKSVLEALSLEKTPAGTIARDMVTLRKVSGYIGKNLDGKDGDEGFIQYLEGGRFHPSYNIHIPRTGRQSANDPPVQTIPRTGAIRSFLVPDSPDHVILSADYEKIELFVLSWLSNEWIMINELLTGVDLHTRMAVVSRLMREPTNKEWEQIAPLIGKDERSVAKGVNFGIPYGRGAYAIAEANPEVFPLNMPMRDRTNKVQRVIDAYFDKYQLIAEFRERQVELVEKQGHLRNVTIGRKRRFAGGLNWFNSRYGMMTGKRDMDLGHLYREVYNFQVQSIAGDKMTRATKRVYEGIKRESIPGLRIILTLHDQLVFSCQKDYADEASVLIIGWMRDKLPKGGDFQYEVPLKVECLQQRCFGEEYQSLEEKEEYQGYLESI